MGQLATLTVYYSVVEAKVCLSTLNAYGIYAWAPLEFVSVAPHWMFLHPGIEIRVVDSDLDQARALLGLIEKEAEANAVVPPRRRRVVEAVSGLIVLLAFGIPPAPTPPTGQSQWRSASALAVVGLLMGWLLT